MATATTPAKSTPPNFSGPGGAGGFSPAPGFSGPAGSARKQDEIQKQQAAGKAASQAPNTSTPSGAVYTAPPAPVSAVPGSVPSKLVGGGQGKQVIGSDIIRNPQTGEPLRSAYTGEPLREKGALVDIPGAGPVYLKGPALSRAQEQEAGQLAAQRQSLASRGIEVNSLRGNLVELTFDNQATPGSTQEQVQFVPQTSNLSQDFLSSGGGKATQALGESDYQKAPVYTIAEGQSFSPANPSYYTLEPNQDAYSRPTISQALSQQFSGLEPQATDSPNTQVGKAVLGAAAGIVALPLAIAGDIQSEGAKQRSEGKAPIEARQGALGKVLGGLPFKLLVETPYKAGYELGQSTFMPNAQDKALLPSRVANVALILAGPELASRGVASLGRVGGYLERGEPLIPSLSRSAVKLGSESVGVEVSNPDSQTALLDTYKGETTIEAIQRGRVVEGIIKENINPTDVRAPGQTSLVGDLGYDAKPVDVPSTPERPASAYAFRFKAVKTPEGLTSLTLRGVVKEDFARPSKVEVSGLIGKAAERGAPRSVSLMGSSETPLGVNQLFGEKSLAEKIKDAEFYNRLAPNLEPQVREPVLRINDAGYTTTQSGTLGENKRISFIQLLEDLDPSEIAKVEKMGLRFEKNKFKPGEDIPGTGKIAGFETATVYAEGTFPEQTTKFNQFSDFLKERYKPGPPAVRRGAFASRGVVATRSIEGTEVSKSLSASSGGNLESVSEVQALLERQGTARGLRINQRLEIQGATGSVTERGLSQRDLARAARGNSAVSSFFPKDEIGARLQDFANLEDRTKLTSDIFADQAKQLRASRRVANAESIGPQNGQSLEALPDVQGILEDVRSASRTTARGSVSRPRSAPQFVETTPKAAPPTGFPNYSGPAYPQALRAQRSNSGFDQIPNRFGAVRAQIKLPRSGVSTSALGGAAESRASQGIRAESLAGLSSSRSSVAASRASSFSQARSSNSGLESLTRSLSVQRSAISPRSASAVRSSLRTPQMPRFNFPTVRGLEGFRSGRGSGGGGFNLPRLPDPFKGVFGSGPKRGSRYEEFRLRLPKLSLRSLI